ncbi:MAG: sugar phosphate isomerase/epimerase [Opitutaceae bacterium]|jgi:sugar phosphate isomerase/epimerase|nr:sugar phosphate isomerase/epimerase [Opitutaceae bacterium]
MISSLTSSQSTCPALPPLAVFTKPWPEPLHALAGRMAGLGVEGVELPVRPGFPVTPENVAMLLPEAVRVFGERRLRIFSVAGEPDAALARACGAAGVPVIRVCLRVNEGENYPDAEARWRRRFDELRPVLDETGVCIGVQNHCGNWLPHAMAIRDVCAGFDPRQVAAVWDAAHAALCGEPPAMGLDLVASHACMVNLKNARRVRRDDRAGDAGAGTREARTVAEWKIEWCRGDEGIASWPDVATELARRRFAGPVCLTAEYSDPAAVDRFIAEDVRLARALLAAAYAAARTEAQP